MKVINALLRSRQLLTPKTSTSGCTGTIKGNWCPQTQDLLPICCRCLGVCGGGELITRDRGVLYFEINITLKASSLISPHNSPAHVL